MSRYIDADALGNKMYHEAFETDTDMQKWDSGCWIRYKMFENAIADAPSIDIEPKRGKWIEDYNGNGWNDYWDYTCSNCGKRYERADAVLCKANFCPNCGARMKGADDE